MSHFATAQNGSFCFMTDHDFLQAVRTVALQLVDAIERKLKMSPRTAEIRQWHRDHQRQQAKSNGQAETVKE